MLYRLGLPLWSQASWKGRFYHEAALTSEYLAQYSSVFNAVEGNATFYATPSEAVVKSWHASTPSDFKFSLKLPRLITHECKLQHCRDETQSFFQRIAPLKEKLGPVMIQLPPSFTPLHLPLLEKFIRGLPTEFAYAVEVRHPDFFDAADNEKRLIDILLKYRLDRVCFDSRALFSSKSTDTYTLDAKKKKPDLPVHAMAIGNNPIVRFVGHEHMPANDDFFAHWADKVLQWIEMGKQPYVFVHLANNSFAPELALHLHRQIQLRLPNLVDLPRWPVERESHTGQIGLF